MSELSRLIGGSTHPPRGHQREAICAHPEVRHRLVNLLMQPEMKGVGYSEFILRAVEAAETAIAEQRRADREHATQTENSRRAGFPRLVPPDFGTWAR